MADLSEELRSVEHAIAEARANVATLRAQVGADGATDPEETAAAIRSADEQESLVVALESRRDSLLRRLG